MHLERGEVFKEFTTFSVFFLILINLDEVKMCLSNQEINETKFSPNDF